MLSCKLCQRICDDKNVLDNYIGKKVILYENDRLSQYIAVTTAV